MEGRAGINKGLAVLFMFLDELCGRELAAGRLRRVSCGEE